MSLERSRERLSYCLLPLVLLLLPAVGCTESTPVTPAVAASLEGTDTAIGGSGNAEQSEVEADCCKSEDLGGLAAKAETENVEIQQIAGGVVVPDVSLVNENGEPVRFRSELVQDRIVAINFIFTSCMGICPPMSANFAQLQQELGDRFGDDVALVSISVDPTTDTPQRLHAWREKFGGGPGWTLLTGVKQDVDRVLKEMEVFTADKNDHTPFILLGNAAAGKWIRVHGLTAPKKLAEIIAELHAASQAADDKPVADPGATGALVPDTGSRADPTEFPSGQVEQAESSPAHTYFTDVELVNQHGQSMRLYSDLLKGKVVVINSFFSSCKGSCPVMLSAFAKIQDHFADRLGKDLYMISITVDPTTDTPERLASYAEQWKAKPGWYFLTGEKENVDTASYKLGQYVENKESHSNIFIIGNEATGLWKKAKGLSKPEELFPLIEEVLNDKI